MANKTGLDWSRTNYGGAVYTGVQWVADGDWGIETEYAVDAIYTVRRVGKLWSVARIVDAIPVTICRTRTATEGRRQAEKHNANSR